MKKKPKQSFSESVNSKTQHKKINPFEVHINRRKYDVLGMKSKTERGLPGVSRTRSLKKRKGTLLQEYKMKDKNNLFLDKRIGERNSAMTAEDKILARYTAERMKFHSKKSIYNLGDDEELTHRGQTLSEIEKFDNPRSDDDDENEEGDGKLDSDFVGDAHFGGGIFKKVDGEPKSRKDLIDQLIAESIKRKAEKQKLRQQTLDMTEKLDSDWKELLPIVTATKKTKSDPEPDTKKDDKFADFDVLSKKLKFETRGKPSDRLKSEEEIAKEEKEKLEELEKDRIKRMRGETETKKHRSADDMDDGFVLGDEPQAVLAYRNGVLTAGGKEIFNSDGEINEEDKNNSDEDSGESESDEGSNEEKEENEDENEEENDEDENEEENDEDAEQEDSEEEEEEDKYSDLKESDESDIEADKTTNVTANHSSPKKIQNLESKSKEENEVDNEIDRNLEKIQKAMEEARKELPFTFDIPKVYEEFAELMKKYDFNFQGVIVERMIKCNHPSLKPELKEDLDMLFAFLLQHLQDSSCDELTQVDCFKVLDRLAPWFFDLVQWNPEGCSSSVLEVIKEKYQDYQKNPKCYPSLDTFVFLKLVSILFPTSDFRHSIVTPSLLFIEEVLFRSKISSSSDLCRGLFLVTLAFEYCALSKRFVPEAINFLYGVLRLAHPKNSEIPVRAPFLTTMDSFDLIVQDKSKDIQVEKLSTKDLIYSNCTESFKVNALGLALTLLTKFCDFWQKEDPAILLFNCFIPVLDSNRFSNSLKESVEEALGKIESFRNGSLKYLVLEKQKPKPLRLYEPLIEEVYTLKKFRSMGKKKAERAKLLHKYKREMKGALREIRRDRSFISKLKVKETIQNDMERHRKVKELLGSVAQEAGDLRKIQRKKR